MIFSATNCTATGISNKINALYSVLCTPYSALCSLHSALFTLQSKAYSVLCTLCSVLNVFESLPTQQDFISNILHHWIMCLTSCIVTFFFYFHNFSFSWSEIYNLSAVELNTSTPNHIHKLPCVESPCQFCHFGCSRNENTSIAVPAESRNMSTPMFLGALINLRWISFWVTSPELKLTILEQFPLGPI